MSDYYKIGNTITFHPGHYVHDELNYMGGDSNASRNKLAEQLDVSRKVLDGLIDGEVDIDVNLAIKLHEVFGSSAQYYLNLQQAYDNTVNMDF